MLHYIKVAADRLSTLGVEQSQREEQRETTSLLARDIGLLKFLAIAAQLGLVLLVVYQFRIEEANGLLQITGIIFTGFVVHTWLPSRFRLPFFFFLSLMAIEAVFGAVNAAWLIGIGLGLIGLCHLPIPFRARVTLVVLSGGGLALLHGGWLETSWSRAVLPILGSMFMFRMIIYLYDLRHEKKPATMWERLSYFFLLPNVCFPLFPVVDYQRFRRTYYNDEPAAIYQKGILWILRGITHLLLYRIIYYYVFPTPSEVQGLGEVLVFVVSSYLLYLRVSGLFHMIIGFLCLFGFNLPETHHHYFLASGFNDVWRRLNIYWKDFMVKIFYYPVLMRIRRWGMTPARVVATLVVFLATWLLHSYQWFWLQGAFPLTAVDGLYWGTLGAFVVLNTLYVASRLKQRPDEESGWSWHGALIHAVKVAGMFIFMSVLWSFWSSASIAEWLSTMAAAGESGMATYLLLLTGLMALIGVGVLVQYAIHHGWTWSLEDGPSSFARSATFTSVAASLLLLASLPVGREQMGTRAAGFVASIQESRLNQQDENRMIRGYYEGLLDGDNSYTSELWWAVEAQRPRDWKPLYETDAVRPGEGVFDYELVPSYEGEQKQAPFRSNQWGMRDKPYAKAKPPGTVRIALLGASIEMGAGVEGEETYPAILEDSLNAAHPDTRHEILNFAVGAYSVVQNAVLIEQKVLSFDPDLVFYAVGSTESRRLHMQLPNLIQQQRPLPDGLQQILEKTDVHAEMEAAELRKRLDPVVDDIIRWGFEKIAAACREEGIPPALIYVPNTREIDGLDPAWSAKLMRIAREKGFVILNLENAYDGYEPDAIRLAPWDWHLSATGHRLVARRLYTVLQETDSLPDLELADPETERGSSLR